MRTRVLAPIPYTWVIIALALLGSMGEGFVIQGIPVLFPFIQEDFGVNRAQLGLITSGLLLGGTSTILFMGWLADTVGVRRLLAVALMGTAGAVLLFSQIQSLVQGVLLAILISVVASGVPTSSAKAIMDWVTPRTRGLSMGINQTSIPLSGFIAAALFPFLAVTFSWRIAVMVLALIIVISSMSVFAFYQDKLSSSPNAKRDSLIRSISLIARNRDLWLTSLSYATLLAVHVVFVSYLILFLKEDHGMSEAVAASFLAMAFIASVVARVVWGLVSDLLGGRRVVVMAVVATLSILSMALMAWLPSNASQVTIGMLAVLVGATALAGFVQCSSGGAVRAKTGGNGIWLCLHHRSFGRLCSASLRSRCGPNRLIRYGLVDDGRVGRGWHPVTSLFETSTAASVIFNPTMAR